MDNSLIKRQDAIDAIDRERKNKHLFNTAEDGLLKARGIINTLPSAKPEPQWIPCSERLPDVRQWVLCYCRAEIMDVLRLTNDGSWNKSYPHVDYMSSFVIAWMPLPKPY